MSDVVLCASFPERGPRGQAVSPHFPVDIALAAAAVAEAALRSGASLLFGAHPTISPIVLQIARLLGAGQGVHIYQSAFFDEQTTEEVNGLVTELGATFHSIERGVNQADSLTGMRQAMLATGARAAFFCGGMDGLREEFVIAGENSLPRYLITAPGGMSAILAFDASLGSPSAARPQILEGRAYGSLVLEALETAGIREPETTGPFETEMYPDQDGPEAES